MKRIILNVIGSIITIVLTLSLIIYSGHILAPDNTQRAIDHINAFHELEDNTLEVIIYGSSHAYKGCDTKEMYTNYGLAAYNYAHNWQKINTTLLFLQDSLRTQTPKVVCIETAFAGRILEDVDMNGEIYYTRAISNFDAKEEYIKRCFGNNIERYVSYYLPLIMFHDAWNDIDRKNYTTPSTELFKNNFGYMRGNATTPISLGDYSEFEQKALSNKSIEVLNKIVQECNNKNVNIIFYTAPFEGEYNYYEALNQYATDNNCVYFNLFECIDFNQETDFLDGGHLNSVGSKKVADFLGEYIVNNYDVTDMRTIENNFWEQQMNK